MNQRIRPPCPVHIPAARRLTPQQVLDHKRKLGRAPRRAPAHADVPLARVGALSWLLGALLALLCSLELGCGAPAPVDTSQPLPEWCANHFCQSEAVTFTAAGEGIYEALATNLERYRASTGREDLGTDPQAGIPVLWRESILNFDASGEIVRKANGYPLLSCEQTEVAVGPGAAWKRTQAIWLDPTPPDGCPDPSVSLSHALIHAMNPWAPHTESDSLFAKSIGTEWRPIDGLALASLCAGFRCETFEPEAP